MATKTTRPAPRAGGRPPGRPTRPGARPTGPRGAGGGGTGRRPAARPARPWWQGPYLLVSVAVVLAIVVGAFVLASRGGDTSVPADQSQLGTAVAAATGVTPATFDTVGGGHGAAKAVLVRLPVTTPPLTSGGLPEVAYFGAEYCPYCAAQRWSMVVALSRFGTFNGLALVRSGDSEGNLASFTFANATYTSRYLTFSSLETEDRGGNPLQHPSAAQQALLNTYDSAPYVSAQSALGIPFVDFGGKYTAAGSGYDATMLDGLDWNQIATSLRDPQNQLAKAIIGNANLMTAAICRITADQPANVCGSGGVNPLVIQLNAQAPVKA